MSLSGIVLLYFILVLVCFLSCMYFCKTFTASIVVALIIGQAFLLLTRTPDTLDNCQNNSYFCVYVLSQIVTIFVVYIYALYKTSTDFGCCF